MPVFNHSRQCLAVMMVVVMPVVVVVVAVAAMMITVGPAVVIPIGVRVAMVEGCQSESRKCALGQHTMAGSFSVIKGAIVVQGRGKWDPAVRGTLWPLLTAFGNFLLLLTTFSHFLLL